MVTQGNMARYYSGRWYTSDEAQKIESYLSKNNGTGEFWGWKDRQGDTVYFSGASEKKENVFIPPIKIPSFGKKREQYLKNKFNY